MLFAIPPATAKSSAEFSWSIAEVFSAAVRFVRVDRGCKIVDRDESTGYVVFECPPDETGKPPKRGALELFKAIARDGREVIRAQVSLADDPRYVELRFLDLLERKLRDERGAPPPPPARDRPPAHAPTDGGAP